MFTLKWIRATVLIVCLVIGVPCLAQNAGTGYDRMDGNYVKPSRREQPKRNFNNTTKERLNIYKVKRSANSRAGASGASRCPPGAACTGSRGRPTARASR